MRRRKQDASASYFLSGLGIEQEIPVASVNVGLSLGITYANRAFDGEYGEDCIEATYYVRDVLGRTAGYVESHCGEAGTASITVIRTTNDQGRLE